MVLRDSNFSAKASLTNFNLAFNISPSLRGSAVAMSVGGGG